MKGKYMVKSPNDESDIIILLPGKSIGICFKKCYN
jgi:hypothetical protein